MVQTDSRWRYDPSTIKLTSYFSLCGQWNPFISGQLLGKFLCDLGILSSSNTMRNPSLETKSRQRVSQHRISRHRLRKCLGSSEHYCGVIPLSLYGTYCWGHSPALTNQNYVLNDAISVSVKVGEIWDTVPGSGLCVSPRRSGPPRRYGPQTGVSLDLINGFCWREKRSRHSWRIRHPQSYISGKRTMACRLFNIKSLPCTHDKSLSIGPQIRLDIIAMKIFSCTEIHLKCCLK